MARVERHAQIDLDALYSALDAARDARGLTWRELAAEVGVSPSTLSRLTNGHRPDADGFAAMVTWLGIPAERFIRRQGHEPAHGEPDLLAELAPLLRSRKDLDADDVEAIEDIIKVALRHRASRRRG